MKKLISNYTFSAATKQVTLNDFTSIDPESLLLITNVTDNIIIYNFASKDKKATISGNVLTLEFDTSSMSDSDSLQIYIDDGLSPATDNSIQQLLNSIGTLIITLSASTNAANENAAYNRRTQLLLQSLAVTDTNQRQRVIIDAINGNLPGSQNININTVGSFASSYDNVIRENTTNTYANAIRKNIEIS